MKRSPRNGIKKIDVLITGVGGQGTVLASDALGDVAVASGYDVKKADVLGMAQRGGSVVSHVRLGRNVHSPLVKKGGVDFLLAFEKLEAARWWQHLRRGAVAIVNDHAVPPLSVTSGADAYPADGAVLGLLRRRTRRVHLVNAGDIASELGNPRVLNVVMLGLLSPFLPISEEQWRRALTERVPARFLELNLRAFARGREEAERLTAA